MNFFFLNPLQFGRAKVIKILYTNKNFRNYFKEILQAGPQR